MSDLWIYGGRIRATSLFIQCAVWSVSGVWWLGSKLEVDLDLIVPDKNLTLEEGALVPWNPISSNYYPTMLEQFCKQFKIPMNIPFEKLTQSQKNMVLYGSGDATFKFHYENEFGGVRDVEIPFEGVAVNVDRRYHETNSDFTREQMRQYMTESECKRCHGFRLNEQALSVKVGGKNISEVLALSVDDEIDFFKDLNLSETDEQIAAPILKEVSSRLNSLRNVGLQYLTLSRAAGTLSVEKHNEFV